VTSPPWWNRRGAVVVVAVAAFFATLIFYCPSNWLTALTVLLTDGVQTALWIAGAAAAGAVVLRLLRLRCRWMLGLASAGGIGLGLFGLAALGLGLAGWLNRITALAMPVAGVLAWATANRDRWRRITGPSLMAAARQWLAAPAGLGWLWIIVVVSLSTAALAATVMPGDLWKPLDPHPYDVTSYHLQVPREWYEAGRIVPLQNNVFSYFPFNVEMQFLLLMQVSGGPWRGMYCCQLLSVGYALLMLLAVAGTSDGDAGAESGAGVVAAAMVSCVPWVIMLAGTAYVESGLMLYTALALAWVMRGLRAGSHWRAMLLAGAFAGLAAGVKITAVPMLVLGAAAGVAMLALLSRVKNENVIKDGEHGEHGEHGEDKMGIERERFQQNRLSPLSSSVFSVFNSSPWLGCGIFLVAAGVLVMPWLARNIVWAGNPLFPVAMHTLGRAHFSTEQVQRFVNAHSPTPSQRSLAARLAITWRDVLANWQYGYLLLPAGIVAAWLRRRDPAAWVLVATAAFTFITWIGFTHLLSRFLVMLVPIAGLLLAEVRWRRAWPAGALLAIAAAIAGQTGVFDRLAHTTRDPVRSLLVGVSDLSFMVPPDLEKMSSPDTQVGLVGDAGAFLYQIPMSRLHYRTVFDLPTDVSDPVAAWVGTAAESDPNFLLVVNPSEIARLHSTYRDVPGLPEKWAGQEQPFVVRGGQ
jgi:hypothetical protein